MAAPEVDPDKKRLNDGWMTLIVWAMGLEGVTLALWAFMGAAMIILIVIFIVAGGRF
jgi:hypothetical protein